MKDACATCVLISPHHRGLPGSNQFISRAVTPALAPVGWSGYYHGKMKICISYLCCNSMFLLCTRPSLCSITIHRSRTGPIVGLDKIGSSSGHWIRSVQGMRLFPGLSHPGRYVNLGWSRARWDFIYIYWNAFTRPEWIGSTGHKFKRAYTDRPL